MAIIEGISGIDTDHLESLLPGFYTDLIWICLACANHGHHVVIQRRYHGVDHNTGILRQDLRGIPDTLLHLQGRQVELIHQRLDVDGHPSAMREREVQLAHCICEVNTGVIWILKVHLGDNQLAHLS